MILFTLLDDAKLSSLHFVWIVLITILMLNVLHPKDSNRWTEQKRTWRKPKCHMSSWYELTRWRMVVSIRLLETHDFGKNCRGRSFSLSLTCSQAEIKIKKTKNIYKYILKGTKQMVFSHSKRHIFLLWLNINVITDLSCFVSGFSPPLCPAVVLSLFPPCEAHAICCPF